EERRLQDEYRKKMQEEPQYTMDYQEGGDIVKRYTPRMTQEQLERMEQDPEIGVRFDENVFGRGDTYNYYDFDLGRFKDAVNYYNVRRQGEDFIVIPGQKNPKAADEYKKDLLY